MGNAGQVSRRRFGWRVLLAGLVGLLAVPLGATEGVNMIGSGPVQESLAGAGAAHPVDSTWVLLNPAALTVLPRQLSLSYEVFAPDRSLDSSQAPAGNPAGRTSDHASFYIPALSASLGEWQGIHWGLGLFGTSGMGVDYSQARIPGMGGDTRSEYSVAKLFLAGAVDLGDGWSVGAGPVLVMSRMRTDMVHSTGVSSDAWDTSLGAGLSLGVYKTWDRWRFGVAYLTEQFQQEWDEYESLMRDPLNLPPQLQVGVAYDVTERVTLLLDYRLVHWEAVPQWSDDPNDGGFGWSDQHIVKIGVEWRATDRLTWRGGLSHGNSPIDESAVFANGLFPAIMETHAALGVSYQVSACLDLHATVTHAFHESLTDDGSQLGGMGRGTSISMHQSTVNLGLGWRF